MVNLMSIYRDDEKYIWLWTIMVPGDSHSCQCRNEPTSGSRLENFVISELFLMYITKVEFQDMYEIVQL